MRLKIFALCVACIAVVAATVAQTQFTATSTVTITRRSTNTQAAANQALQRDIERYVRTYASGITSPTQKDAQGVCLPYTQVLYGREINVEIYNRDATTCAPLILQSGKTDLRSQTVLDNVLERLIRVQFNQITDDALARDKIIEANAAAVAENAARQGEKP